MPVNECKMGNFLTFHEFYGTEATYYDIIMSTTAKEICYEKAMQTVAFLGPEYFNNF